MTHEDQIPIWGYINFQVLYEIHLALKEDQTSKLNIHELIELVSKRLGSSPSLEDYFDPINSGAIFGFLYTTLVVPKELNNPEYFEGIEIDLENYFDVLEEANDLLQSNDFYRILRNSISHVNYKVESDNQTIRLWNINRNGYKNVEVETDLNRLSNFGVEIAKFCNEKRFNSKKPKEAADKIKNCS